MLTDEDVDDIERRLGELPYVEVRKLIAALRVERATSKQLREAAPRRKILVMLARSYIESGNDWADTDEDLEALEIRAVRDFCRSVLGDVSAKGAAQ